MIKFIPVVMSKKIFKEFFYFILFFILKKEKVLKYHGIFNTLNPKCKKLKETKKYANK